MMFILALLLFPGQQAVDPARDTLIVENTPIDFLDFANSVSGLGSKMGIDATNKWPGDEVVVILFGLAGYR